jgi:hypothetical protein
MENNEKKVKIDGTNNRYLMKKVMKTEKVVKKRKAVEKMNIEEESFSQEKQHELLSGLLSNQENHLVSSCKKMIDKKISSYKMQDLEKKRFSEKEFITYREVIEKLESCELQCHYCEEDICILYNIVRDSKQWTLDRNNNDLGHNSENVVISCLKCNLERRRTNQKAFLFTKNLKLVTAENNV